MARLKNRGSYAKMPSLDGAVSCSGRLFPAEGRAWLRLTDHSTKAAWTWSFHAGDASAKRWRQLGISPVVWQFRPPRNLPFLNYGDTPYRSTALTIAIARDVLIVPTKKGHFTWFKVQKPTRGLPTAWTNPGLALQRALTPDSDIVTVRLLPHVKIIHVQDPSLMPQFDRPDSIMGAIGAPFLVPSGATDAQPLEEQDFDAAGDVSEASRERLGLQQLGGPVPGLLVLPQWNGATIRSQPRGVTISIKVKDQEKPAGFVHTELPRGSLNVVFVHRNENVSVTVDAAEGIRARETVYVYVRTTPLAQVPIQGQPMDLRLSHYKKVEIEEGIIPGEIKFFAELAISVVPVVGTLYDLGQLAYMIATGKDFWGDRASAADVLLGGSLTVVSMAVPALRQGMRTRARNSALSHLVAAADDVADMVPQSAQSPVVDALRYLRKSDADELARKVDEAMLRCDGVAAARAVDAAVKQALQSVDEQTHQALLDRMVKDLFTPDVASFRDTLLRDSYDFYKGSKKGQLSALEWLLKTEGMWVAEYMKQLLGSKWKGIVKAAFGIDGKRVIPLSMEMLDQYDVIIRKLGLEEYSVLQNMVRKVPGFGQHFELDHIVEQRFLRRFEEWTDALPEDAALMTFIVPRNAEVAAEILRLDPNSKRIKYVHQAKTDVMRQLVPHGAEHLFSVQHIADATLYALKSLDAHQSFPTKILKGDFAMLTLARAKNVDAHDLAATKGFWEAADELGMPKVRAWEEVNDRLVSVEAGFPQVERVNGVWRLAGSP